MTRPLRSDVFDPDEIGVYHCFNRIVRRSYLCGLDPLTGIDYSYRRQWFYDRLRYLAGYFCIDVLAYAILSNHFHLVLRNRPDQVESLSDRQVVTRWLMICPKSKRKPDGTATDPSEAEIQYELNRKGHVAELRKRLSDPSWLLRQVCQHMGIRCNSEDSVRGHFWESRFGMDRLCDEADVLACLAYVDLNPIRAGMVESLEAYPYVSVGERLRTLDDQPIETGSWLSPLELASETDGEQVAVVNRLSRAELGELATESQPLGCLPITLPQYAELLRWLAGGSFRDKLARKAETPAALVTLHLDPSEFAERVSQRASRVWVSACPPAAAIPTARGRPPGASRGRVPVAGHG